MESGVRPDVYAGNQHESEEYLVDNSDQKSARTDPVKRTSIPSMSESSYSSNTDIQYGSDGLEKRTKNIDTEGSDTPSDNEEQSDDEPSSSGDE